MSAPVRRTQDIFPRVAATIRVQYHMVLAVCFVMTLTVNAFAADVPTVTCSTTILFHVTTLMNVTPTNMTVNTRVTTLKVVSNVIVLRVILLIVIRNPVLIRMNARSTKEVVRTLVLIPKAAITAAANQAGR